VKDDAPEQQGMRCGAATWLLRSALEARQGADSKGSRTVLVVEDDAPTRRMFATFLRRRGYEVLEADHGQGALAMARRAEPGVVVLDVQMPVLDGLTTAELLKLDATTAHIPLIAVTGQIFEGGIEEARRYGFAEYLPKPVTPAELASAIDGLFSTIYAS
jgi:two-component system cell cycle response regulator DivK